ncbi:MAG: thioredoxin family protein [Hyphomicrobium sp.]
MLRSLFVTIACLIVLPFATAVARAAAPEHADLFNGAEINWRDPKSGIYEATKTGKPVIMVMHATWCSACKRYRAVFKDAGIVAASKDFVMILVDAEKEKEINGAFSPDGTYVPRTLFIDTEGEVSNSLVGKDAQYPHTIDVDKPDELLTLMLKAKASGFGQGKPAAPAADGRT